MTNINTLNAAEDKQRSRTRICRKDQTVVLQNSVVWNDWTSDNLIGINCWFSFCHNASILLWNVASNRLESRWIISAFIIWCVSDQIWPRDYFLLEYLSFILEISFCDSLFCSWFSKTTENQTEASCSTWQNHERHETSSKDGRRISKIRRRFFTKTNKERVTETIIMTTTYVQTPELLLM